MSTCRYGITNCGGAGSRTSSYLASRTSPTISMSSGLFVPAPRAIRLPTTRSTEVELSGERFVDDGDLRRSFGVRIGEFPSGQERNAESAKVVDANSRSRGVGVHAWPGVEAFNRHVVAPAALREDRNRCRSHRGDARHRAKLGVQSIEELGGVVRCVAVQGRRQTKREQAFSRDTQIHACGVHQTHHEQAGDGEQSRSECQLGDGHRRAKARRRSGARGSSGMRIHTARERCAHAHALRGRVRTRRWSAVQVRV